MISETQPFPQLQTPVGLNHLVLRVRDIDESHVFWTQCLGLRHVGTTDAPTNGRPHQPTRFYSGQREGRLSHHDIALVEDASVITSDPEQLGLDHIAIEYASDAAWVRQIDFLFSRNIAIFGRIRRGTTLSAHVNDPNGYTIELVCELPRELWESDINAALNKPPVSLDAADRISFSMQLEE